MFHTPTHVYHSESNLCLGPTGLDRTEVVSDLADEAIRDDVEAGSELITGEAADTAAADALGLFGHWHPEALHRS